MDAMRKDRRPLAILGVTGSVAAYRAADLARELQRRGIRVRAAMTDAAKRLVGAPTMRALTGHPVLDDEWGAPVSEGGMDHIAATRGAGLMLVAPASADFIAKAANGIADDLLLAMLLARDCPALFAPAMNRAMWENPITQANVSRLVDAGIGIVGPDDGDQACGESGFGRLAEISEIADRAEAAFLEPALAGLRIAVSAGATCERLDPMRIITNASSGKMGLAVARAAALLGAEVRLVAARMEEPVPAGMRAIRAETGEEMERALMAIAGETDVFISAAAVADYRPAAPSEKKATSKGGVRLELGRTPDILAKVASLPDGPFCVGFAAESGDLLAGARRKIEDKGIPMIVANDVAATVGSDDCELTVIEGRDVRRYPRMSKRDAALELVRQVGEAFRAAKGAGAASGAGRGRRSRRSKRNLAGN